MSPPPDPRTWLTLLVLLSFAAPTGAQVVTLGATKDVTLYETAQGNLANGSGIHFFVGRTNQGPGLDRRRGAIEFDVAGSIPPGSQITGVTLRLYMSKTSAGTQSVSLHFALEEWGEGASDANAQEGEGTAAAPGDATWLHTFYPSSFWSAPGGDFIGAPSATTGVGGVSYYTWSSSQMIAEVQTWLDDPASNHGWILLGNEANGGTSKRFDTREVNQSNQRPRLEVSYIPVATNGACCLGDGTCVTTDAGGCALIGGTYQGDRTHCDPNPCPQPSGACCLDDGSCAQLDQAACDAVGGRYQGHGTDCGTATCTVVLVPFVDALPLPQVATPVLVTPSGQERYAIAIREIQQSLHRDLPPTTLWGYDGLYPGPTIEALRGQPLSVLWASDIRDPLGNLRTEHFLPVDLCLHGPHMEGNSPRTVVHLHGGHVPAEFDGYPEHTILPGEDVLYVYPNDQLPATLWYHDHALGITRLNVLMGLAGFYLLRDPFELRLGLPEGEFEVPLAVQDRTFLGDGSFLYPVAWEEHFFGDTILVNGKAWPYLEVKRGKYRFRVLNGSNSRTYTLSLSSGHSFLQIGTDGGLLPAPLALSEITLTPGERADLVLDFEPHSVGAEVLLLNSAPAPYPGSPGAGVIPYVMKFVVQAQTGHTAPVPAQLRPLEELLETSAVEHRELRLSKEPDPCTGSRWTINGLGWSDVTEFPKIGTTEVWSFVNQSSMVHPMHMHLVMFQILDRQDFVMNGDVVVPMGDRIPRQPSEAGWKDTAQAAPHQITRVIARFESYFGLFPYHCHILEHEDHEMMRQFEVVPGDGVPFCFGVGCPCSNDDPNGGCANGELGVGSRLFGTGTATLSADSLVLNAMLSTPSQPGLFFQGDDAVAGGSGLSFGDGLRCAGGNVVRLQVRTADGTGAASTTIPISASGGASPGQLLYYQWWYRDPSLTPCGFHFNLSNGLAVTWGP